MQLWLVRHAVAAERDEFEGPDNERPLTAKGRKRFREFCKWLADQTTLPGRIVSSPLARAAETAEILAKAADQKKSDVVFSDLLAPGLDTTALLQSLHDDPHDCTALVGHEPDMSQCLSELVGGGQFAFGKGFIAAVEFDGSPALGTGHLRWLVGPKM